MNLDNNLSDEANYVWFSFQFRLTPLNIGQTTEIVRAGRVRILSRPPHSHKIYKTVLFLYTQDSTLMTAILNSNVCTNDSMVTSTLKSTFFEIFSSLQISFGGMWLERSPIVLSSKILISLIFFLIAQMRIHQRPWKYGDLSIFSWNPLRQTNQWLTSTQLCHYCGKYTRTSWGQMEMRIWNWCPKRRRSQWACDC